MSKDEHLHQTEHPHGEPPKEKPVTPPSPPGLGKDRPPKVDEKKFA